LANLVELARDNAVEGKTWSALLAHHQAHGAEDPAVRATLTAIADDALCWRSSI
jgi:hypothetical protein